MEGTTYRALQTRELEQLLHEVVAQRMGPTAARVLDAVIRLQSSTLHTLCGELRDEFTDNGVREALGGLMKHEAVGYNEGTGTYSPCFGTGILPAFFPVFARFLADAYHQAAELIALTLFEFHDLPAETLIRQILRAQPDMETGVRKAFTAMLDDEVLVGVGSTCPMVTSGTAAGGAQPRLSGSKRPDRDTTTCYQFSWPVLLTKIRADRIRRFVGYNVSPTAEKVLGAFLATDANQPSAGRTDRGFPKLHHSSSPQSAGTIQRRFPALQPSAIISAIEMFTSDPTEAYLMPSASSASSSADPMYAVSYVAATRIMQRELYEAIVLSRHGIVGSRIVKLLAENEAMEDRFIAEEALVTHVDARLTLTAMLRDGMVKLLELPKGSITADRIPKNSIFLWTLNKDQLLETLQVQVVKALTNSRTALTQELAAFRDAMPPSYFIDPASVILSTQEAALAAKHDVQRCALQHAVVSLLERALVALYF
jgi:transcription initiation factor IIE alpha subunit